MGIDEAKMDYYAQRLYAGGKKRIKLGESEKKERISPVDALGKEVVRKCGAKCDVCNLLYKDPSEFDIHHIDGDSSNTTLRNLTLVCKNCHGRVHGRVRNKLKEYAKNSTIEGNKNSQKTVKVKCGFCGGSGRGLTGLYSCPVCKGAKMIEVYDPPKKCTFCDGTGTHLLSLGDPTCPECGGKGYTNAVKKSERT